MAMHGGGVANLDAYVRACELPDPQLVTFLGTLPAEARESVRFSAGRMAR